MKKTPHMISDSPKIQPLLELGQPETREWPDYVSTYNLSDDDVPALLELFNGDKLASLCALDYDWPAAWAQLHAWRALGQLGSEAAIEPIINSFDTQCNDDYGLEELSVVMGLFGPRAIEPLASYWQRGRKEQFADVLAMDSLFEIAGSYPQTRDRVIAIARNYMANPTVSNYSLNTLLMAHLVDIGAREAIDGIRQLFALDCIDISCAGDLEDIEIELGLREQRSTPRPSQANFGPSGLLEDEKPEDDDIIGVIEYWLMRHGSDESLLDASEMDGYIAAIVCSPETIEPSRWMQQIWGDEQYAPEWENQEDAAQFLTAVFALYHIVIDNFREDEYQPIYLESTHTETPVLIVDEWCEGFLRGLSLWGAMPPADMAVLEQCLYPIRHFTTDEGAEQLDLMSHGEIEELQNSIHPQVRMLYQHFFEPVKIASGTFVHATPKVGRNEPCPCGSGKKYKKCCGLH
jgi:uncharacterized protein